jgi:hypothetical protein
MPKLWKPQKMIGTWPTLISLINCEKVLRVRDLKYRQKELGLILATSAISSIWILFLKFAMA